MGKFRVDVFTKRGISIIDGVLHDVVVMGGCPGEQEGDSAVTNRILQKIVMGGRRSRRTMNIFQKLRVVDFPGSKDGGSGVVVNGVFHKLVTIG